MTIIQSIILGILQGFTEFLPISSSGHLILAESFLGLHVADLMDFDIVVHLGTLLAILVYFRTDITTLFKTLFKLDFKSDEGREIGFLIIGTIPVVVIGYLLGDSIQTYFRNPLFVGIAMLCVATYFLVAEWLKEHTKMQDKLTWGKVILIGIAQCIAIIPGVSRSGSTIATGVLTGLSRVKAARFSFLLGSIAIAGAGTLLATKFADEVDVLLSPMILMLGFVSSAAASYFTVSFLMKFLKNNSLRTFAYYLLVVGLTSIFISL